MRARLGIPDGAKRVMVFAESSHWDPDWLLTSEEYYRLRVRRILDGMLRWLEREPERVYSIECVFFLRMYWDRNPEQRERIRAWVNRGRIRLSGSGINTPDTILPELEAVIRDYLHGQEWLRRNGMHQEPRLAYLPDNFGHTPRLPAVLNSLGYEYCAFSRVDGILFPGSDYLKARKYPLEGSSAALLLRKLRSADFIWRNKDGSRLLCHLNPYTYGQGDTIAHKGLSRWMGIVLGNPFPTRDPENTAKRVESYLERLSPFSRTPYLFCPIGFDFNQPIPHLSKRIREYNQLYYPSKGVFAVIASLEDYMDLVSAHSENLPVIDLDPNPYFMGFYSSRPEAKQLHKEITGKLVAAEKLLSLKEWGRGKGSGREEIWERIREAWDESLMVNHHDFITGTSPQRVWEKEQRPLLLKWSAKAGSLLRDAAQGLDSSPTRETQPSLPSWSMKAGVLKITTPFFHIELDEGAGGCITRWTDPANGGEVLSGPANDIISYLDSGGLWRMGHEYGGGILREKARASSFPARVYAREESGGLTVRVVSFLEGHEVERWLWIRGDTPVIRMRIEGMAALDRTVTCLFPLSFNPTGIMMDVTGGLAERPLRKLYDPTFWAARSFAFLRHPSHPSGLAVFLGGPATVSCSDEGNLELVAMRTARRERVFGLLPLLAHPASGRSFGVQKLDYAVLFVSPNDHFEDRLQVVARELFNAPPYCSVAWSREMRLADSICPTDDENVSVLAVKRALRGEGYIMRLFSHAPEKDMVAVRLPEDIAFKAYVCDARERDLEEIGVAKGKLLVRLRGAITTIRLLPQP